MTTLLTLKPKILSDKTALPADFIPGENDVICGRGSRCFNHEGNKRFRYLVQSNLKCYMMACSKFRKSEIICFVVEEIRSKSTVGGFVKEDLDTGHYFVVSDFYAREKTSQAFRDALVAKQKRSDFCGLAKIEQEKSYYPTSLLNISSLLGANQFEENRCLNGAHPYQGNDNLYTSEMMCRFLNPLNESSSRRQVATLSQTNHQNYLSEMENMFNQKSEEIKFGPNHKNESNVLRQENSLLQYNYQNMTSSDTIKANPLGQGNFLFLNDFKEVQSYHPLVSPSHSNSEEAGYITCLGTDDRNRSLYDWNEKYELKKDHVAPFGNQKSSKYTENVVVSKDNHLCFNNHESNASMVERNDQNQRIDLYEPYPLLF